MQEPDVCAVVGVGPGLGLAIARRFGREGLFMGLLARDSGRLAGYAGELAAAGTETGVFAADAADAHALGQSLQQVAETLGPVSVLVYNAAQSVPVPPTDLAPADLLDSLRVNVVGALAAVQAVLPGMRERGRGTILITGGGLALTPSAAAAALSVGKAGVRALALTLAQDLEGSGVRVSTVTIRGRIEPDTPFDPERIAQVYWDLHAGRQAPPAEVVFDGRS